jgi:hypothetical protein
MKNIIPKISLFLSFIIIGSFNSLMSQQGPYTVGKCGSPPPSCAMVPIFGPALLCSGESIKIYAVSEYPAYGYTFQWWQIFEILPHMFMWGEIDGATSDALTIYESSSYKCYVTPPSGDPYYTREFVVEVASYQPSISANPGNNNICLGGTASFSITASGDYLRYQWQRQPSGGSWTDISGATTSSYSYTPAAGDDGCLFKCIVRNGCNPSGVSSASATLDIIIPPDVTDNPDDVTICEQGNTFFSISTTGDISTRSWEYSTNNVNYSTVPVQAPFSGTNTSQLTLLNTGLSYNNYYFRCKVTNSCNVSDYSTGAKLTVQTRLTVNSAPSGNYYVCDGSPALFSVSYSGTFPISVQWQEYINGWSNLSGQTSSSLTFPVSMSMNNRQYRAVLTQANTCNTTISTTAGTLIINALPKVETQPLAQEKCRGENATFSITGSGAGIFYQWQISRNAGVKWSKLYNGGHYSGVTTSNLVVSNLQDSINGYQFRCQVGGTCTPIVTSNAVNLIVDVPPLINAIDQNQVKCIGQPVTIKSYVSGTAPFTYRWRKDGVSITDWTSLSEYTIAAVGSLDAGKYDYLVKNICNATGIESDDVTLSVNTPPSVNIQPSPVTICEASPMPTVKFTTNVSGGSSLLWQVSSDNSVSWTDLVNNAIYSGTTTNELTITAPSVEMNQFHYRCQIAGSCDPPVSTNSALLTIKTMPDITVQPNNDTVCSGASVTFSVTASSNIPMEYKWKQGGQGITDWLSFNSLVIDEVTLDNYDNYQVMIRNECAYNTPVTSELAYLKVIPPPVISLGVDQHICPGNSISLDPGTNYASYSWSTGETTRSIEVTEQGNYTLNVTDENGCANSDKVYVYLDPSIPELDLGEDARYCKGDIVVLNVTDQFDTYAWKKQSTNETVGDGPSIQINETDTYSLTAWNSNSVCRENDLVHILVAEPFKDEKVCLVSVDPETEKNMVIWEKTENAGIASYNIYREFADANEYDLLGNVPFNALSVFVDPTSQPELRHYKYKISVIDTCGNETDTLTWSPYHKTLLLTSNLGPTSINLDWDEYEVELGGFGFVKYYIYRGNVPDNMSIIDSLPSDSRQYPDYDPPAGRLYYRIAGVKSEVCDPANLQGKKAGTGPYSQSMSNIEDNRLKVGLNNLKSAGQLTIYPNPAADFVTIGFSNPGQDEYQLIVRDLAGKTVLMINNITEDKVIIESGKLKAGYYTVVVTGSKIYHGKLIVE